jgi:integrase
LDFEKYLVENVREITAKSYNKIVKQLSKIGPLDQPQQIKTLICTAQVSEGRKELLANAYNYYCKWKSLNWSKPSFIREDKAIYLPLESELDALIANTKARLSLFLQLLKETGVDSGEAWKLRWVDLDIERKTLTITPTKNHASRILPISNNLIARLLKMPRTGERIFNNKSLDDFRTNYGRTRNRLALKLENPRIHEIQFKSFRHWFATTQYQKTRDILHVQHVLGHKRIEHTLVYTHLVNFANDDWTCKTAKTVDECKALIESGFEYVSDCDGYKLFRKRK